MKNSGNKKKSKMYPSCCLAVVWNEENESHAVNTNMPSFLP